MGRIGLPEIIIVFLIIVILFGAKKLPEIGQALGKALREFRNAGKDTPEDGQGQNETNEGSDESKRG